MFFVHVGTYLALIKKTKVLFFFLKPKIKPIHFRLIGGSVSSFATSGEICMAVFMFDLLV